MKKKTIILLWLVTAYSCSNYSSRLKAVLDYSGTNRAELEKVLDHYSQDPADSLKLKASIFLIENMPGHYTFGGPYMKSYNEQLGLLKNCPYYEKKIIQMVPFDHIGYRQQLDIQEDVKYIKADFLIHQIELAFNQWQTRPWNEGVDFENFKEYLLPYRVENEPLDYWRDSISPLQKNLETYSTYYDNFRHSISQIENRFRTFLFMLDKKIPEPDLKNFKSDCIPTSKANLFVLRILGVPSAIDFIRQLANRNGRH